MHELNIMFNAYCCSSDLISFDTQNNHPPDVRQRLLMSQQGAVGDWHIQILVGRRLGMTSMYRKYCFLANNAYQPNDRMCIVTFLHIVRCFRHSVRTRSNAYIYCNLIVVVLTMKSWSVTKFTVILP